MEELSLAKQTDCFISLKPYFLSTVKILIIFPLFAVEKKPYSVGYFYYLYQNY